MPMFISMEKNRLFMAHWFIEITVNHKPAIEM